MTSAVALHHSSYAAMIVVLMALDTCELCQVTTPVSTIIQVPRMRLLFRDVIEWRPAHLGVYQNELQP